MSVNTEKTVLIEDHGPVRLLTLNRPKALNALSGQLIAELAVAIRAANEESSTSTARAIVITGNEKAFCAGADITQLPELQAAAPLDRVSLDDVFDAMATSNVPIIAAVRGMAFGGGLEIMAACDMAIAGESASLAVPEVKLGVLPGGGGTQRLVHAMGKAKAMKMLLTGEPIDAAYAQASGLVSDVVVDDKVVDVALKLGESIAANAPLAVRLTADAARAADSLPLDQGLARERANFLLALGTKDATEGITAFAERRAPEFTGE